MPMAMIFFAKGYRMDRRKKGRGRLKLSKDKVRTDLELHQCPNCDSELVYPITWEEKPHDKWRLERYCPECEWHHVGDFTQDEVELFDDALNDGTEELLHSLRTQSLANMKDDVERLIKAIWQGHIEPMDF